MEFVTLEELRAAARRIDGGVVRTPLLDVELPGPTSPDVRRGGPSGPPVLSLKCENLQPMGAFKLRGALNLLTQLTAAEQAAGVIAYSSGNHGQAVALAARRLGIRAVIVVPETIMPIKLEGIRRYGADVILAGTTSAHRQQRAEEEAARRGLTIVPPFDDRRIIAGQGTVGLEILEQKPDVQIVFVPVGGGGLASGVSAAVKRSRSDVRVIGVEPSQAAKMSTSIAAGRPTTLERTGSIADGLLAVRPGDLTFAHVRQFVDEVVTVDETELAAAVKWLFREARLVAEPSGAASVAGALKWPDLPARGAVAVVSGGNVDPVKYAGWIL